MAQDDYTYMNMAIGQARVGRTPFGALLVQDGRILAEGYNTVARSNDPTAHGEIVVIRKACETMQKSQLHGATLYTTGEPCPMCMSAAIFSGIGRLVYGVAIDKIARFMPQIRLSSRQLCDCVENAPEVEGPVMGPACELLFQEFTRS